jgi:Domain of unknown function (DUF1707)/2TM domain
VARQPEHIRVSDDERERVVARLHRHCAAGRLSAEELDERIGHAYAARTGAELEQVTADLPAEPGPYRQVRRIKQRRELATHAVVYLIVNLALVAIWAVTWQGVFWPIFSIAGWGVALAIHAWVVFSGSTQDDDIAEEIERRIASEMRRRIGS